jgi:hypothetical protein
VEQDITMGNMRRKKTMLVAKVGTRNRKNGLPLRRSLLKQSLWASFFYLSILKFHVFGLTGARENRLQSQSNKRTQSTTEELGAQDENQEGVSEAKTETLDTGNLNQIGLADGFARVGETVASEQPKEEQLEKDE